MILFIDFDTDINQCERMKKIILEPLSPRKNRYIVAAFDFSDENRKSMTRLLEDKLKKLDIKIEYGYYLNTEYVSKILIDELFESLPLYESTELT
jgi:hypothetical protein